MYELKTCNFQRYFLTLMCHWEIGIYFKLNVLVNHNIKLEKYTYKRNKDTAVSKINSMIENNIGLQERFCFVFGIRPISMYFDALKWNLTKKQNKKFYLYTHPYIIFINPNAEIFEKINVKNQMVNKDFYHVIFSFHPSKLFVWFSSDRESVVKTNVD